MPVAPKRLLALALIVAAVVLVLTRPVESARFLRQGAEESARLASGAVDAFSTFIQTLL